MTRLFASTLLLLVAGSAPPANGTGNVDRSLGVRTEMPRRGAVVDALVDLPPPRARRALELRAAEDAGDAQRISALLAPDSRVWFESRTGPGEPRNASGRDAYADWDRFFRAAKHVAYVGEGGDSVAFELTETNDFYRLLDRPASHARLVYWFDAQDRVTGTLVQSLPRPAEEGNAPHRMEAFKTWEARHDPAELAYLLPGGRLKPDLAHAKRWKAALIAWRRAVGLPEVR